MRVIFRSTTASPHTTSSKRPSRCPACPQDWTGLQKSLVSLVQTLVSLWCAIGSGETSCSGRRSNQHPRATAANGSGPLPTALAQPGPDQTLRLRAQGSLETPSRPRTGGTRAPHTGTPAGRGSWIYAHACSPAAITCRPHRAVRAPVSKGMVRAAGKQSRLASYDGAQQGKEALAAFWAQDGQPASASSPLSFCIFSMAPLVVGALLVPCCPLRAW